MIIASRAAAGSSGGDGPATQPKAPKGKGKPLTMDEYFDRLEVCHSCRAVQFSPSFRDAYIFFKEFCADPSQKNKTKHFDCSRQQCEETEIDRVVDREIPA